MSETAGLILLLAGALFMALSGFGLLRMPDVYLRLSASSKSSTLGVLLCMAGAAVYFADELVLLTAFFIVLFVFLTAPVASHMIGRAARKSGVPLWEKSVADES